MEVPKMKRVIVCFLACAGVAVMLSACGDNGKTDSGKKSAIKETAEGADKTADYLIGKKALEQGQKAMRKLDKAQADYNKNLEKALEE